MGRAALRSARSNDLWRQLYRKADSRILRLFVRYSNVPGLGSGELTAKGPIAMLCGENGVGKSRALKTIYAALGGPYSDFTPKGALSLPGTIDEVTLVRRTVAGGAPPAEETIEGTTNIKAALAVTGEPPKASYFDPPLQVPHLLQLIRNDQNFSDLYEGITPQKLTPEQVEEVSMMVGRSYTDVSIYEIADYQDHETTPYFRVTSEGDTYGAENMGLGELSLLFAYWILLRAPEESILLLEEPETFIAPRSQRALIDLVASEALQKRLFVVLTSHSGVIAERVPNAHLELLSRARRVVSFLSDPPTNLLIDRLALIPPRHLILLVEDQAARNFTLALLEAKNSRYYSTCDIIVAGGDSHITEVLRRMPSVGSPRAAIIGVFDGDQHGKLPSGLPRPVIALPGGDAPERVLKRYLESLGIEEIAQTLNKDVRFVSACLAGVAGKNHHDWMRELCATLSLEPIELFRPVVRRWAAANSGLVTTFFQELDDQVKGRG